MVTLDLTNKDKSTIKYEHYNFPDGQQQVVLHPDAFTYDEMLKEGVKIKARLNNFMHLEKIVCANQSLKALYIENVHLYTPYVVGARSDRSFEGGDNNYLKQVICPIINTQKFKSVTVLDPHSDCLEMGLNGFKKETMSKLLNWMDIEYKSKRIDCHAFGGVWISPDAGASKKIFKLAEKHNYKGDIITCSKDRDASGKLTKTIVPMQHSTYENKNFVIIDDICDGGRTFINIAEKIRVMYPDKDTSKIYLIVTHGIFSNGFEELSKYFSGIYCTNSYSDIWDGNDAGKLVKQCNIF